jgi:hypothetical protein
LHLKNLHLAGNSLDSASVYVLTQALRDGGRQLCELDLSDNRIGIVWKGAEMRSLADLLLPATSVEGNGKHQGLRRLDLADNSLDDAAIVLLADGLRQSQDLQALSLARNSIKDRGMSCLADALREQRDLLSESHGVGVLELDVSSNPLGNSGLEALAEVCTSASSSSQPNELGKGPWGLTRLRIENHCASNEGRAAIYRAVKARTDLVQGLLRMLSGHNPPKEGRPQPPKLLRVDEVDEPAYNDLIAETSLARHWEEHFGTSVVSEPNSPVWHLQDELRAVEDEHDELQALKESDVYMAHLPSAEDPHMVEEAPTARRNSWLPVDLPDLGNISSWFADEDAPDALDKFWADEDTVMPQENSDPCYGTRANANNGW